MESILEVKDLRKSFGNLEVLKGISFSVRKGEVIAIIGSSGSGKTTFLRCLNFLERPDSGQITVSGDVVFDGAVAGKESDKEIRKKRLHFGLVFQSFNLFPHYNVKQNLSLSPKLMLKEERKKRIKSKMDRQEAKRLYISELHALDVRVDEVLTKVGLLEKSNEYPCRLSGGQQQRVAIARALILNPDILCFDEPTSALDPELTGEVLKVIRELKESNITMLVVTHEMEFAREVADTIIYMADGKIEEMGSPSQLFGSPKSQKTQSFLKNYIQ